MTMRKNTLWWAIGLFTFFMVFFTDLTLVLIVLLAPLAVVALGSAVIGVMINSWINQSR